MNVEDLIGPPPAAPPDSCGGWFFALRKRRLIDDYVRRETEWKRREKIAEAAVLALDSIAKARQKFLLFSSQWT